MDRSLPPRGAPAAHHPVHPSDNRAANRFSQVREDTPHTQDIADSRASLTPSPGTHHTQLSSDLPAPLGAFQGASQLDNSTLASGIQHPPAPPYNYAQAGQFDAPPLHQYTPSPYSQGYGQSSLQQPNPPVPTGYTQGYASGYTPGSASGYTQGYTPRYTQGYHAEEPRQSNQFSQQQTYTAPQARPSQAAPYGGVNTVSLPVRLRSEHERARPRPPPIFIPSTSSAFQTHQQAQAESFGHFSGQGQHVSPTYPASSLPPQPYYFQHGGGPPTQTQPVYTGIDPNNGTLYARPEGPSAAPIPSQAQQAPRVDRRQSTAFRDLIAPRQNASTLLAALPAASPAPAVQLKRKRKATSTQKTPQTSAPAFRNTYQTPHNQNPPQQTVEASPYPSHPPAPAPASVSVVLPPPDPDALPQAITATYARYTWSVYHFTLLTTRYDFADTFLADLYKLRHLHAHRWRTHSTRGFIPQGTRLSFLVLFNAADPFGSSSSVNGRKVKDTTTIGCYGRYAHEAHKEIHWITFAADLRALVQQMLSENYVVLTRKWTAKEQDPGDARFHKAYWLSANLRPLMRLLNHRPYEEEAHDALTEEEEEMVGRGFEVCEGDLQGAWVEEGGGSVEVGELASRAVWAEVLREAEEWRERCSGEWGGEEAEHFVTGASEAW